MTEQGRTYIAIDLKSFYASVECRERGLDPLTANLVVADESRTDKTICLAVSPSLKALGLSGRCRLFEVRALAAAYEKKYGERLEYITAVPRMALYMKYSADIYSIYMKYVSPEDVQVYSIDEVFIDATDYMKLYHLSARELAVKMIRDVLSVTGITATAGIAPNLYLCKAAMDIVAKHVKADEEGVRICELGVADYRRLLWDHRPLTDFWRVGPGIARKLEDNGMKTMGDVARMSLINEDWLFKLFGIDAEILIDHAWGFEPCRISDIKKYKPADKTICSAQILPCAYSFAQARIVVSEMAQWLALELEEKHLKTDRLMLYIAYDKSGLENGQYRGAVKADRYGRMVPKPSHGTIRLGTCTSLAGRLIKGAETVYDRVCDKSLPVRRLGLTAGGITEQGYEQLDLFTDPEKEEKEKKVQQAMLSIQQRYGKNAILKGTSLQKDATMKERNSQIGGHKA